MTINCIVTSHLSKFVSCISSPSDWLRAVCQLFNTQYAQSCTGTLWSRHFWLIFSGKWKTTTHITIWKCMTIQFTTWFWWHTWACMYEICLNTLSVVSIDYSVFIFSYRFGLAVLFLYRDHKVPVQLYAYCALCMCASGMLIVGIGACGFRAGRVDTSGN